MIYPNDDNIPGNSCLREGEMYFDKSESTLYICSKETLPSGPLKWQVTPGVGGSKLPNYQEFYSNGTFTVPVGITRVKLTMCGAGGGGGYEYCGAPTGGKAGACYFNKVVSVTPKSVHNITIGTGGTGGYCWTQGAAGTATSFGSILTAAGGNGGVETGTSASGGIPQDGQSSLLGNGGVGGSYPASGGAGGLAAGGGGAGGETCACGQNGGSGGNGYVLVEW